MPRPPQYDPEQFLDSMLELFWVRGYQAVTLPDMLEASGVSRSTLYTHYRSKEEVFRAVLARYQTRARERFVEYTQRPDPAFQVVTAILKDFTRQATKDECGKGCFLLNIALELGATSPEIRTLIQDNRVATVALLQSIFARGVETGEFSTRTDPKALAHLLFVVINGLQAEARTTRDPEFFQLATTSFHNLLEAYKNPTTS